MRSLLASLAASYAAASSSPVSYSGYQVLRVSGLSYSAPVREKLSAISYQRWEGDDIVVSPTELKKLENLGLNYRILHKDLGESIAAEKVTKAYRKRDINDLAWYDSYHPYADHIQYFTDLQAAFPKNSKLISSGRSYQNRSIHGIHLFGDAGPGKPAVLYQ